METVNRVFDSFEGLYVQSYDDVIVFTQGSAEIRIPTQMVHAVIEAVQQAAAGDR
jgi:hypothetical protein